MTSQLSTHKLLKLEIKQNSWILALNALLHLLTGPVLFLLNDNIDTKDIIVRTRLYIDFFTNDYFFFQIFVMIVCIAIDIYLFRYLFFSRMVDLYHSMPISRKQLFITKYLNGFLLWFSPFAVNLVCIIFLTVINLGDFTLLTSVLKAIFQSTLLILLCFFIFYHLFLTAVTISGNILNLFANVAVIGFVVYTLFYLLQNCAFTYLVTYCQLLPDAMIDCFLSLSPFLSPFGLWLFFTQGILKQHWLLLLLSILLALFMGILSYMLYQKRPSELAERGTNTKPYTILSRILVAILAAIGGALFFNAFAPSRTVGWTVFGALLCAPFAFGILSSIYHTSIKAFFRYKTIILLTTIASTALILSFQLDLFGYDTYIADIEDIEGIAVDNYHIQLSDSSSQLMLDDAGHLVPIQNPPLVSGALYTDPIICDNLLNEFVKGAPNNSNSHGYYVKVGLRNGNSYTRYYQLANAKAGMLAPLIETEDYKNNHYKFSTGGLGYPQSMKIQLANGDYTSILDTHIKRIMDAYAKDFEENYTFENLSNYFYTANIRGEYIVYLPDGTTYKTRSNLPVKSNYKHTLAVLRDLEPYNIFLADKPTSVRNITFYFGISKEHASEDVRNYINYGTYTTSSSQPDSTNNIAVDTSAEMVVEETRTPAQCIFTDQALLDELMPYLYFGYYENILYSDMSEANYIYLGEAEIHENMVVSVFKKPGELPEKFLEYIDIHMTVD